MGRDIYQNDGTILLSLARFDTLIDSHLSDVLFVLFEEEGLYYSTGILIRMSVLPTAFVVPTAAVDNIARLGRDLIPARITTDRHNIDRNPLVRSCASDLYYAGR
jgi:hypothetical protein